MQVNTFIEFAPVITMDPNGYTKSEPSPKGRSYRNLLHWVDVNDFDFENINQLGEGDWDFRFIADSNFNDNISYISYIDACDLPNLSSCYVCMTFDPDSNEFIHDESVQKKVEQMNTCNPKIQFTLDTDSLHCTVKMDRNADEVHPEHFDQLIYQCFEAIESIVSSKELAPWIGKSED